MHSAGAAANLDVRRFGALGDGRTDDVPAITKALSALGPEGGTIYFPQGRYAIGGRGIILAKSNVTLRGSGMFDTVFVRTTARGPLLQSGGAGEPRTRIVLEGLGFEGTNTTSGEPIDMTSTVVVYGQHVRDVRVQACRFWRSPVAAISLSAMRDVTIEKCTFESPGDASSTAISVFRTGRNIAIRGNTFRYLQNGIIIDTGESLQAPEFPSEQIEVSDNTFDLGWWLIKERFGAEGESVTFTANSLTDDKARFEGLRTDWQQNIRVLPIKERGHADYKNRTLIDPLAQFRTHSVRRGDIVRSGDRFAMVSAVSSETSLEVEAWLSEATRQELAAPASGDPYTVYGVLLGMVRRFDDHTITTTRWWDFDGNSVTPAAGTRYEVLTTRPNYPLHAEAGVRDIKVFNNVFKRGWSDQISIWGERAVITNNVIEDGEDMGITLHGREHRVTKNRISHQGAGGIWANADDSVIEENDIDDSQWVNNFNDSWLGDIIIDDGNRNLIERNRCERLSSVLGYNGIVIAARSEGSKGNILRQNRSRGHLKADIRFTEKPGAKIIGTVLEENEGSVVGKP